jgi:hypothetical protein
MQAPQDHKEDKGDKCKLVGIQENPVMIKCIKQHQEGNYNEERLDDDELSMDAHVLYAVTLEVIIIHHACFLKFIAGRDMHFNCCID